MDIIFSYLQSGFSAIVPFVILLGLLIFVHELGHFLVAKYYGVRVETFSLGFGKKIWSLKRGDTTYCIGLIPLGGYVKMFGDEVGSDISEEQKKYSFLHKPLRQRVAVVLAGPLMNLFFAVFLFGLIAIIGEDQRGPRLGDISVSSPAFAAGFRSGDTIKEINEKAVETWNEFNKTIAKSAGQKLSVKVQREQTGRVETLSVVPGLVENTNILELDKKVGGIEGLSPDSFAAVIGISSPKSAAALAGLQTADRVVKINDQEVNYWRDIESQLRSSPNKAKVTVIRGSIEGVNPQELELSLNLPRDPISNLNQLGIEKPDVFIYRVMPKSPALAAGFVSGDKIKAINGKAMEDWTQVLGTVKSYDQKSDGLNFVVVREGVDVTLKVVPQVTQTMSSQGLQENRYTIGIQPTILHAAPAVVRVSTANPISAFTRGVERSYDVTKMTLVSFVKLISAEISPKNIGGVISIGQAASETFKIGVTHFITMMGVISINLFILNLLPIPVLDGGHLVFYAIEGLKGSPLNLKKMELAQRVGMVLLMSLMIFALFNDVTRLFSSW